MPTSNSRTINEPETGQISPFSSAGLTNYFSLYQQVRYNVNKYEQPLPTCLLHPLAENRYAFFILRADQPNPSKPLPSNNRLAGSGVGTGSS